MKALVSVLSATLVLVLTSCGSERPSNRKSNEVVTPGDQKPSADQTPATPAKPVKQAGPDDRTPDNAPEQTKETPSTGKDQTKAPQPDSALKKPLRIVTGLALGRSQFMPNGKASSDQTVTIDNPADTILVIYNHGSIDEFYADPCTPTEASADTNGTPRAIQGLSQKTVKGKQILVYAFCTPSVQGQFNATSETGEPKVEKRARDIATLLTSLVKGGFPRQQIFLAGWSAGGWASLLLAVEHGDLFNGLIAIAPAFAGPRQTQTAGWKNLQAKHIAYIQGAIGMKAYVVAFDQDPFNRPLDLGFIATINGATLNARTSANTTCADLPNWHLAVYQLCFDSEVAGIVDFIQTRS